MKKQLLLVAALLVSVATTFAQNVPSYVPTNGLVGWWPFNGNANDESGMGNNGTVNGATLTTDRNGKSGNAYSFDGVNDEISIPNSQSFSFNSYSISLWVRKNGDGVAGKAHWTIISKNNNDNRFNDPFHITHTSSNAPSPFKKNEILVSHGGGSINNYIDQYPGFTLTNGSWNHILVVFDNNKDSIKTFINGQLSVSNFLSYNNLSNSNPVKIGVWAAYANYFNGLIDDIAIYNRALTQQEITNLYLGCKDETATTSSLSGILLTNSNAVNLNATPSGGSFSGEAVANGQFVPSKAHLGKNSITYNFTNSTGCKDSTDFSVIVYDTLGNVCSTYDTLKIKVKITAGVYANQSNVVKIYPNPTNTDLVIDNGNYTMLAGYKVSIFNSVGAKVYEGAINSSETTIPLSSLGNKGIYIVRILDSNSQTVESKTIVLE